MIASMNRLSLALTSLLVASLAMGAQEERTIESLIAQLQSPSVQERTRASQHIYGAGIADSELYSVVANAITSHGGDVNGESPAPQQQEIAWHAKALGGSANIEYMPILEELSESSSRTVAKHAKKSIDLLRQTSKHGAPYLDSSRVTVITDSQRANCDLVDQVSCNTFGSYDRCIAWHKERAARAGANAIMVLRESGTIRSRQMANYFSCSRSDLTSPELIAVNLNNPIELKSNESSAPSYIDELKGLADLRDQGVITEEEFQQEKSEILAKER